MKLHHEILDFYEFIKPSIEEDEKRDITFKIVKNVIKDNFPDLKVKRFGSYPNKLHLPDSDIDIVVLSKNHMKNDTQDQTRILKKITQKLLRIVEYIRLIDARVPIIKATLKDTGVNMDIR